VFPKAFATWKNCFRTLVGISREQKIGLLSEIVFEYYELLCFVSVWLYVNQLWDKWKPAALLLFDAASRRILRKSRSNTATTKKHAPGRSPRKVSQNTQNIEPTGPWNLRYHIECIAKSLFPRFTQNPSESLTKHTQI
jgi:hypothetical protein